MNGHAFRAAPAEFRTPPRSLLTGFLSVAVSLMLCLPCRADITRMIVRFEPDVISFPGIDAGSGHAFQAPLSEAEISLPELRQLLAAAGVLDFRTLAPGWRHLEGPVVNRQGIAVDLVDFTDVYLLRFANADGPALIRALAEAPGIVHASIPQDYLTGFPPPDDTLWPELWHLDNQGQTYDEEECTPDLDIDADTAWTMVTGAGTKIGFLDTGADNDHPDLEGSIDYRRSRGFGANQSYIESCPAGDDHGTPVAGLALARGNNTAGVAGVANTPYMAPSKPIVALNVMGEWCDKIDFPAAVDALGYVTDHDLVYPAIMITSNSWFGRGCFHTTHPSFEYNPELRDAFRNCYLLDITTFACVGNFVPQCVTWDSSKETTACHSNRCWHFPAAFSDYCIGVRGITCTGGEPHPQIPQATGFWVDLTAPTTVTTTANGGGYETFSGCSAATPIAAGVAALMLQQNGDLTNDDVSTILRMGARDLGVPEPDSVYGAGLVRADDALRLLRPPYRLFHASEDDYTDQYQGVRTQYLMNFEGANTTDNTWEPFTVQKYKLEVEVSFPGNAPNYNPIVGVWGRGPGTTGARDFDALDADVDSVDARFWGPFLAVDSTTISPFGCTLFTYTYKVYDSSGQNFLCWYPLGIGSSTVCGPSVRPAFYYTYLADTTTSKSLPEPESWSVDSACGERWRLVIDVGRAGIGSVSVYNALGREIVCLEHEVFVPRGPRAVIWNGTDKGGRSVPSGVYFVVLSTGNARTAQRVQVVR